MKRELGQYFTITNPFELNVFKKWLNRVNNDGVYLEPFAGANHIPKLIKETGFNNPWACFDIEPSLDNKTPEFVIVQNDSINNFPQGYDICITNPPYLGKSSASRRKLSFPDTDYDDLYKLCLDKMLNNCRYVAAIIPESFITAELFHDRLEAVVSLQCKMFDDTECPVCLALFGDRSDDFAIYKMDELVGYYSELKTLLPTTSLNLSWKFNDPDGVIGVKCIDNQKEASIYFCKGSDITSPIKVSSRSFSRISGVDVELEPFLDECNRILNTYRSSTKDVFMTSFKGIRKDGQYRRRLDFATIRLIMNVAYENLHTKPKKHS